MAEEWLSISQFADAVGRSIPGIHLLIKNKDERVHYQRAGKYFIVHRSSLANFPKKKKETPVAPRRRASRASRNGR